MAIIRKTNLLFQLPGFLPQFFCLFIFKPEAFSMVSKVGFAGHCFAQSEIGFLGINFSGTGQAHWLSG
jgi:hypothetical protein